MVLARVTVGKLHFSSWLLPLTDFETKLPFANEIGNGRLRRNRSSVELPKHFFSRLVRGKRPYGHVKDK